MFQINKKLFILEIFQIPRNKNQADFWTEAFNWLPFFYLNFSFVWGIILFWYINVEIMAKNFHINTFSLDQSENGTAPARPLPPPREIRVKRTPIKLKHKFFLFSEKRFRKLWNTNRSLNWITAPEEAKKISVILFEISSLFCCIL